MFVIEEREARSTTGICNMNEVKAYVFCCVRASVRPSRLTFAAVVEKEETSIRPHKNISLNLYVYFPNVIPYHFLYVCSELGSLHK